MSDSYYIFVRGEKEGPYTDEEIGMMLEDEVVSFRDYCMRVGDTRRVRLDSLFEEFPSESEEEHDEDAGEDAGSSAPGHANTLCYSGHPSFLRYPFAWMLCAGSAIGGYLLGPTSLWYFIVGSLIAVATVVCIVIDRSTRHYIVTPRRIEVEWGLIVKSSNEVRIGDVRTVNVRKSGLKGLLGIGTIEFSSAGDDIDVTFADVHAAHRVKRLVRELQDAGEAGGTDDE